MDLDKAHQHLTRNLLISPGRFFAEGKHLAPGVGQLYSGVRFPIFDDQQQLFVTAEGLVYVLTHECDVDQTNVRPFNTHILVCPIIDFRDFIAEFEAEHSDEYMFGFLTELARRNISRVIYIPQVTPHLPYGGLLYFNRITHTHVDTFRNNSAELICTVTNYGLRVIDYAVTNHMLRPKADVLPL